MLSQIRKNTASTARTSKFEKNRSSKSQNQFRWSDQGFFQDLEMYIDVLAFDAATIIGPKLTCRGWRNILLPRKNFDPSDLDCQDPARKDPAFGEAGKSRSRICRQTRPRSCLRSSSRLEKSTTTTNFFN